MLLRLWSRTALGLLVLLASLALAPSVHAQITVDGDLSDWDAITPQGVAFDPCNELFPLCKSGFDFTRVLVNYDAVTDTLFFGIDIMDVDGSNGCLGNDGPGVPGDADGDLDPCTDGDLPECEINQDQDCIGVDEQYLLKIDTNFDGDFTDAEDVRVVYRGNFLRFETGAGVPFNWSGDVRIGTAGAASTCGCANENPATEDIEIAVHDFSQLDANPVCFIVDAIAGSLVDIPPEDFLDEPIIVSGSEGGIDITKRVRNVTQNTSFAGVGVGANIGETVEFELVVCNTGNTALTAVTVTDSLKAGFENPVLIQGTGCAFVGSDLTCNIDTLAAGDCVTILYQTDIAPTAPRIMRNMGFVTGTTFQEGLCGGEPVNDNDDARVFRLDIECEKEVSLDGVNFFPSVTGVAGQTVTFRVTVTNDAVVNMPTVNFTDTLPAGYINIESLDGRVGVSGNTLSGQVGPLPKNGGFTEILYRAEIAPAATGTLMNTASFTAVAPDATETTTSCSADVTVGTPAIDCLKLVSLDGIGYLPSVSAAPGQTVFFRVIVENTGSADLFTASLTDTLPPAYSNIQVTQGACGVAGQTITCAEIGPIVAGGQVVIEYRAVFNADSGTHTNTAFVSGTPGVSGNPGETVTSNCSAFVNGLTPSILCIKGVSTTPSNYGASVEAFKGQTVYYEVQVFNNGLAPFYNATVEDLLPAGLTDVEIVSGSCLASGNQVDCDTGFLDAGQTATFVYKATLAVDDTTLVNTVTVTGLTGSEANPGTSVTSQCSATVTSPLLDIECTKEISGDGISYFPSLEVVTGQTVFFRVTITNTGDGRMRQVTLNDLLPDGYANILVTQGGADCTIVGQEIQCERLGPFDSGQMITYEYQAEVIATNPPTETLVNTAQITGQAGTAANPSDPELTECSAIANLISPSVICTKQVSIDGVQFFDQIDAAPGQIVLFRVEVTNDSSGPVTFDPVTIVDALPAGYTNLKLETGNCSIVGNTISCDLGVLEQGESAEVLYRAKVAATTGTLVNTAEITASHTGGDVETDCSASVNVVAPEIICIKEASKDGVTFKDTIGIAPGQLAWFRVTISNSGTVDMYTHSLEDILPAGFTDVEILEGPDCVINGGTTVSCDDLGPLLAGGPDTVVVFRARLVAESGPLVNIATVSGQAGSATNPSDPVTSQCPATVDVQDPEIVGEKAVSLLPTTGFGPSVTAVEGTAVVDPCIGLRMRLQVRAPAPERLGVVGGDVVDVVDPQITDPRDAIRDRR